MLELLKKCFLRVRTITKDTYLIEEAADIIIEDKVFMNEVHNDLIRLSEKDSDSFERFIDRIGAEHSAEGFVHAAILEIARFSDIESVSDLSLDWSDEEVKESIQMFLIQNNATI